MKYDLNRFLKMQERDYAQALSEIHCGRKLSHWIWYIFPQLKGLGYSYNSQYYGLDGMGEAQAYMDNRILADHLIEISEALLSLPGNDPTAVMGYPDDLKLKSSMTLFAEAVPEFPVFQEVLDRYFQGEKDSATLKLLK